MVRAARVELAFLPDSSLLRRGPLPIAPLSDDDWCARPDWNRQCLWTPEPKSGASTYFATRA